jgi:O-acetyl-ADP-ribose deacetylase (regulator of RNase III)
MVSAANSFGLMDGGVDAAIAQFFGYALQERGQQRFLDEFLGEQLVVTSLIVETGHPKHPFIAHTPTMRVPMHIAHTDHVYVAGERSWGRTDDVKVRSRRRPRDGPVLDTIGSGGR